MSKVRGDHGRSENRSLGLSLQGGINAREIKNDNKA